MPIGKDHTLQQVRDALRAIVGQLTPNEVISSSDVETRAFDLISETNGRDPEELERRKDQARQFRSLNYEERREHVAAHRNYTEGFANRHKLHGQVLRELPKLAEEGLLERHRYDDEGRVHDRTGLVVRHRDKESLYARPGAFEHNAELARLRDERERALVDTIEETLDKLGILRAVDGVSAVKGEHVAIRLNGNRLLEALGIDEPELPFPAHFADTAARFNNWESGR